MPRSNQRGDTLVEVVMAFALLAMVMAGAFSIANLSQRIAIQARERTIAVQAAQSQAERLFAYRDKVVAANPGRPRPYGSGPNIFNAVYFPDNPNPPNIDVVGNPGYYIDNALAAQPGFIVCGLPNCTVTVRTQNKPVKHPSDPTPAASWDNNFASGTITVTWDSAVSNQTNTSQITIALSDTRAGSPRDCSVKGTDQCTQ